MTRRRSVWQRPRGVSARTRARYLLHRTPRWPAVQVVHPPPLAGPDGTAHARADDGSRPSQPSVATTRSSGCNSSEPGQHQARGPPSPRVRVAHQRTRPPVFARRGRSGEGPSHRGPETRWRTRQLPRADAQVLGRRPRDCPRAPRGRGGPPPARARRWGASGPSVARDPQPAAADTARNAAPSSDRRRAAQSPPASMSGTRRHASSSLQIRSTGRGSADPGTARPRPTSLQLRSFGGSRPPGTSWVRSCRPSRVLERPPSTAAAFCCAVLTLWPPRTPAAPSAYAGALRGRARACVPSLSVSACCSPYETPRACSAGPGRGRHGLRA